MIKKLLILTALILVSTSVISAQEATDSGDQTLTDKIKERLQDTAEEGLGNIKDALTNQVKGPRKKAYMGSVTDVTENSVTLQFKNDSLTVNFDADTDIFNVSGGRANLDPEDLEKEDFLLAFGFVYPDNANLQSVEIQRITKPEAPVSRQVISGPIEEIDGNQLTVSAKSLTIGSKTDFAIAGEEDPDVENLALEDYLFTIVTLDENGDIDIVNSALVLPGKNNPLAEEPTNSPEATKSGETEDTEEESQE